MLTAYSYSFSFTHRTAHSRSMVIVSAKEIFFHPTTTFARASAIVCGQRILFQKKIFFLFLHWNLLEGWGKFTRNRWTDTQKYEMIQINGHILCVKTETKSDDIETFCLFHDNASYLCLRESSDSISLFLINHMRRIAPLPSKSSKPSERNFFVFLFCQFPISYDFNFIRLSCFSVGLVLLLLMKASYVYKFAIKWKERNYYFGPSTWEFAKKSGYFCEQMKWIHIFFSILFRCVQCLNGSNAGWCSPHSIKCNLILFAAVHYNVKLIFVDFDFHFFFSFFFCEGRKFRFAMKTK